MPRSMRAATLTEKSIMKRIRAAFSGQRYLRAVICLLGIACGLSTVNCSKDSTKPKANIPPDLYLPATSAQNVLVNLETAYNASDIDGFTALLHPDFEFVFSEEDQAQPGTPAGLNFSDEAAIHTNMFSELVDMLALEFVVGDPVFDAELSAILPDSVWRVEVTQVELTVEGRLLPGQPDMTPVTWELVGSGSELFWLQKGATAGKSTDPTIWLIRKWEEITISGTKGFEGTSDPVRNSPLDETWGSVKMMFY